MAKLMLNIFICSVFIFTAKINAQNYDAGNSFGQWRFNAAVLNYVSYSQQKNSMPVGGGYPVITAETIQLGLAYKVYSGNNIHDLILSLGLPVNLGADNGTGANYILRENEGIYLRGGFDYRLSFPMLNSGSFLLRHSFVSGALYEMRELVYLSGSSEKTEDVNLYVGPGLQSEYSPSDKWKIEGSFDARFFLPYLNYGKLTSTDSRGAIIFTSDYRGFYYQTVFRIAFAYEFTAGNSIKLGVEKNDIIGFANRKALFYPNDIVHYKFDRLIKLFVEYNI